MVSAAKGGVELCLYTVIPSLFPFFVLSSLVVCLGVSEKLQKVAFPIMKPLFGLNGACSSALILGAIGGYPVGAKTVVTLYNNKLCTRSEAQHMLAFCNNSGPAFIFGIVGAGVFGSVKIGLILYAIHIISALIVGIIFRFIGKSNIHSGSAVTSAASESFPTAFTKSVTESFSSCIGLSGFVIFFAVFINLLSKCGILEIFSDFLDIFIKNSAISQSIVTGLIELTSGIYGLMGISGNFKTLLVVSAFMLGWGGLSVHFQTLSILDSTDLSPKTYFVGKLMGAVISGVLAFFASSLLPPDTVSVSTVQEKMPYFTFTAAKISVSMAIVCLFIIISTKKGGKFRKKAV
jgi:sporulation integral membrane protein YlbJ